MFMCPCDSQTWTDTRVYYSFILTVELKHADGKGHAESWDEDAYL